jgi:hypothetical protein
MRGVFERKGSGEILPSVGRQNDERGKRVVGMTMWEGFPATWMETSRFGLEALRAESCLVNGDFDRVSPGGLGSVEGVVGGLDQDIQGRVRLR